MAVCGGRVVAQRKLLFLEKLFASLLLGGPRLKDQLESRIALLSAESLDTNDTSAVVRRRGLIKVLTALKSLLYFYLPAVFRLGYKVRCCTWEGHEAGTRIWAREIMEQCFVLLVHLLDDKEGKNEYVRTLAVALATWQPWMGRIPAVCFVEESCEAMLSRMGHRCDVYRNLHGFENTFDLFLTLPPPKRGLRATRGMLKAGLVAEFASRIRIIVFFSGGDLCFAPSVGACEMHSTLIAAFPEEFKFPDDFSETLPFFVIENILRRCLRCLIGKSIIKENVQKFMDDNVPKRDFVDLNTIKGIVEDQITWFKGARKTQVSKSSEAGRSSSSSVLPGPQKRAPARKIFLPKPKGVLVVFSSNLNLRRTCA